MKYVGPYRNGRYGSGFVDVSDQFGYGGGVGVINGAVGVSRKRERC